MILINRLIKDNQRDLSLNRLALRQMRGGCRATSGPTETTAQSIARLTAPNAMLREANAILRNYCLAKVRVIQQRSPRNG
jgi:hypothetical protein